MVIIGAREEESEDCGNICSEMAVVPHLSSDNCQEMRNLIIFRRRQKLIYLVEISSLKKILVTNPVAKKHHVGQTKQAYSCDNVWSGKTRKELHSWGRSCKPLLFPSSNSLILLGHDHFLPDYIDAERERRRWCLEEKKKKKERKADRIVGWGFSKRKGGGAVGSCHSSAKGMQKAFFDQSQFCARQDAVRHMDR